jgi:hypothetical protein
MERAMIDLRSDLRKLFDSAMWNCLEAYEVLPDGRSFVRSDEDERAIGLFENLRDSVDAMPPSLIKATEELRADDPERFEYALVRRIKLVGSEFLPACAAEFVEVLNESVQEAANISLC